jgi:hypothetical protein
MGGYLHVGHLWSSTGVLLASTIFTNESTTGWQQVAFSSPVPIQANAVYVVSFSTGGGYFGITTSFFTNGGVSSGPLQALPSSVTGGDGVYSRAGAFPSVNGNGMNFWADVAFTPSSSSNSTPKAVSTSAGSKPTGDGAISVLPTRGQSNHFIISVGRATPTRPAGYFAGPLSTTIGDLGSVPVRQPIVQNAQSTSLLKKLTAL